MNHAAQGLHGSLAEAMAAVMGSDLLKYGGDFFRPPNQHQTDDFIIANVYDELTDTLGHTMSSLQFSARQFPQHPVEWLHEIADAYRDAYDTLPFMPLVGVMPSANKLFHLAPRVAVKFRGLPLSRVDAATEAALSSYVASQKQVDSAFDDPYLAFAFCYLASHFGLDLISKERVEKVMGFLEENKARLAEVAGRAG